MNPLTPYMLWIKLGVVAAILLGCVYGGYHYRDARADAQIASLKGQMAKERANAERAARAMEHAQAVEVQQLMDENAKEKAANEATQTRLVDDLIASRRQLRERWRGCVPGSANGAAKSDDAARDRAESAGRIVRAADDADTQIRALQEFIRAERASGRP